MTILAVIFQVEDIKYLTFFCRQCGDIVHMETGLEYKLTDDRCETCKSVQSAIHTPTGRKADTI